MKYILVFILSLISPKSHSQEWNSIKKTDDGRETFIREHSENKAWIKVTNVDVKKDFLGKEKVKGYKVFLFQFNCNELKIGQLVYVGYDQQGNELRTDQIDEYLVDMKYAIPDSEREFYLKTFCSKNW
jgi:hypothetical protein